VTRRASANVPVGAMLCMLQDLSRCLVPALSGAVILPQVLANRPRGWPLGRLCPARTTCSLHAFYAGCLHSTNFCCLEIMWCFRHRRVCFSPPALPRGILTVACSSGVLLEMLGVGGGCCRRLCSTRINNSAAGTVRVLHCRSKADPECSVCMRKARVLSVADILLCTAICVGGTPCCPACRIC